MAARQATVHVTARVPRQLAQDFERIARREERSVSAELRKLMRHHVETVQHRATEVATREAR